MRVYTPSEERALLAALAGDAHPTPCPRCGAPLDRHDVPPRDGVPYVRHRVQVVCTGCGASVAVDRKAIARVRESLGGSDGGGEAGDGDAGDANVDDGADSPPGVDP